MSDALDSARIKLKRANLHASVARREARRFFGRQGNPPLRIEAEGDHSQLGIGSLFTCKLVAKEGWPPLPEHFSARIGDAIHNYRCALDHTAWQLVSHGLRPPSQLSDREQRRVQFPIYSTEKAFKDNIADRLPGVDPVVTDFVKARHVYIGGQATNDALLNLADLSNDDKHKTLPLVASAFLMTHAEGEFRDCDFVRSWNPAESPAVIDEAVICFFECRVTGPQPHMNVNFTPTVHIAMESGAGFGDVLAEIRTEIREILTAPEILAAVT